MSFRLGTQTLYAARHAVGGGTDLTLTISLVLLTLRAKAAEHARAMIGNCRSFETARSGTASTEFAQTRTERARSSRTSRSPFSRAGRHESAYPGFMQMAELLPAAVCCRELWGAGDPATLSPEEMACTAGFAAPRLREFAAGRSCARLALADLGVVAAPLLVGSGGEPLWPAGCAGSVTHTEGYCAVAVCRIGTLVALGIDAERLVELERPEWQALFCRAEIEWLDSLAPPERLAMACALFSGKEAYFKCLYPLTRRPFEPKDLELRFGRRSFAVLDRRPEPRFNLVGTYGFIGTSGIVATTVAATSTVERAAITALR
jgi:4'-phosphopantetheinyl transferase EntD